MQDEITTELQDLFSTGSFTGSLTGRITGTGTSPQFVGTSSWTISSSRAISSSYADFSLSSSYALSSSRAETASYALNSNSGDLTGTGTTNYIPQWTGNKTLGNSTIYYRTSPIGNVSSNNFYVDKNSPSITITDPDTRGGNSNAVVTITGETSKSGGPATAKYVTKKVVLDAGFDSGDLAVYLTAYRPVNTDINVYYKILNRGDTMQFNDGSWQLMTKTNSSNASFSQTRDNFPIFLALAAISPT